MTIDPMTCDEALDRIEPFVDGELGPEATDRLRAHLAGCRACAGELALAERIQRELRALPQPDCPPELLERVVRGGRGEVVPFPRERAPWRARFAAAAALLALAVGGGSLFLRSQQPRPQGPSPQQVAEATRETRLALAYLGRATRKAGFDVRDEILEKRLVIPTTRSVSRPLGGPAEPADDAEGVAMMRMLFRPFVLAAVLLLPAAAPGLAQKPGDRDGYISIESLDLFPSDDLEVEINIDGPLLNMVATATKKDDPEFSSVVSGLKAIQVQVYPLKGVETAGIKTKIGRAVRLLEEKGWKSTVRVKDKGDETYIYLKESGGRIAGLTLFSLSPGTEAVVINIVGRIDPAQLGQLGQTLHVPQLQKIPAHGGTARKPE